MRAAIHDIDIPDRAPKVRRMKRGAQVDVDVDFSILPARAVSELSDWPHLLLVLAAFCQHTSAPPYGIAYPSQKRLAKICNRSEAAISVSMRRLEQPGFVRRLTSRSKFPKHSIRRQLLYQPDAPIPPKETERPPGSFAVLPWQYPFNDGREAMHRGVGNMVVMSTRKLDPPVSQNEIGRQNYEATIAEAALMASSRRVAAYFARKFAEKTGKPTQPAASVATARKWLLRGISEKECLAHVHTLMVEGEYPLTLADYREPMR